MTTKGALTGPTENKDELPFIGRESLITDVRKAMAEAKQGTSVLFLVSGEAGIGKSALVRRIRALALEEHWTILSSECMFKEGGLPYQPIVQAIEGFRPKDVAPGAQKAPDNGQRINLPMGFAAIQEVEVSSIEQKSKTAEELKVEMDRMYESVSDILADLASRSPVLFLIDDLHWADRSTCHLLYYLVRSLSDHNILFFGTFRPEDVDAAAQTHPLSDLKVRLQREGLLTHREIRPFTEEETSSFLLALYGSELPHRLISKIHKDTNGNPYFIHEFIGTLRSSITSEKGREKPQRELTGPEEEELKIPSSVSAFINGKMDTLAPDELKLIQFGSVIGPEFQYETLVEASNMPEDEVVSHLEVLTDKRIIHEVVQGDRISYRFTHNLVREVIYSHLSRSKRRLMHRMVGAALEKVKPAEIDKMLFQLAYHFTKGVDVPKAIRYNILAGNRSANTFALEEARHHYEVALDLLTKQDETDTSMAMEVDLLNKLGRVSGILGDWKKASGFFLEAIELTNEGTKEQAMILKALADAEIYQDQWKGAEETLRRAIKLIEEQKDPWLMADAYLSMSFLSFKTGRSQLTIDWAKKAQEMARLAKDKRLVGKAYLEEANAYAELLCDYPKAISLYEKVRETLDPIKDMDQFARMYCNLGDVYCKLKQYPQSVENLERCIDISNKTGDIGQKSYGLTNIGLTYMEMNEYDKALKYMDEALVLFGRTGNKHLAAMTHHNIAQIRMKRGDIPGAEQSLLTALGLLETVNFKLGFAYVNCEYGRLLKIKGQSEKGRDHVLRALGLVEEIGSPVHIENVKEILKEFDN